jgi:hypothetical protein
MGLTCPQPGGGARAFRAVECAGGRIAPCCGMPARVQGNAPGRGLSLTRAPGPLVRRLSRSLAGQLAALPVAAALQWNPVAHLVSGGVFGTTPLGRLDDPRDLPVRPKRRRRGNTPLVHDPPTRSAYPDAPKLMRGIEVNPDASKCRACPTSPDRTVCAGAGRVWSGSVQFSATVQI